MATGMDEPGHLSAIRPRHPLAVPGILVLAAGFIAASLWQDVPAPVWLTAAAGLVLAWAVWIDAESFRIPDALTLPLFCLGLGLGALGGVDGFINAVFGAVLGYSVMRLMGFYMDWRLKASFMMYGDAKLMAGLGALTGWEALPAVLLIGSVSGLVEAGLRAVLGRPRSESGSIPFGPHLVAGFVTVWLFGIDWISSLW